MREEPAVYATGALAVGVDVSGAITSSLQNEFRKRCGRSRKCNKPSFDGTALGEQGGEFISQTPYTGVDVTGHYIGEDIAEEAGRTPRIAA